MTGPARALRGAVFLDKDGTLLVDVPYNVDPARMRLAPGVGAGLARLARLGLPLVVVSNQAGIAMGRFDEAGLAPMVMRLRALFALHGAVLHAFHACPHHPDAVVAAYRCACVCRKPMPGLLRQAAADHGIALDASWMVGDILDDVEAGRRAGCRTVLIDNGNETEWLRSADDPDRRTPHHVVADFAQAARVIALSSHDRPTPRLRLAARQDAR